MSGTIYVCNAISSIARSANVTLDVGRVMAVSYVKTTMYEVQAVIVTGFGKEIVNKSTKSIFL